MSERITVTVNGKRIYAEKGDALSVIINGEQPCGGHGRCGKCKIIARGCISEPSDAELEHLSGDELARGVRLACCAYAYGDCEIEHLESAERSQIVTDGTLPEIELRPAFSNFGVAIDIGTTTVAAKLYGKNGAMLTEASRLNPQSQWGADVISRIEAALGGNARELAKSIRNALDGIIFDLSVGAGIDSKQIDGAIITGNTVMLSLLIEESVEPLSHAPFDAKRLFGEALRADELELSALAPSTEIYLPPCISAFVGADITCALLATELCENGTAMLADIGTNGELALWHGGKLTVCSTAAGPAFEGAGISMGMRGAVGAIDKVSVSDGKWKVHVIGDTEPTGICGSGLVDAIACMLNSDVIDESGFLEDEFFVISAPVSLTRGDIRMVQLAKSAICAGMLTLKDGKRLSAADIDTVYIAGGFGRYLNIRNAEKIGLLPPGISTKARVVGNAALGGASMLLLNSRLRAKAEGISQNAKVLDLSSNPVFSEYYMNGMLFDEI